MSKTIWFVNHYAGGPGISSAFRAYELSRAWQADGHRALVVMASFNNPAAQIDHHPQEQVVDGVRYVAVRTRRYHGNGVGRIAAMAQFSVRLFRLNQILPPDEARPDAIIVSSVHPFPIFAGAWLARKHKARLVFEIRDLWPLTLTTLLRKSKYHPFILLCAFTERFAARYADLIASVLPRANQYFIDNEIRIKSFVWVPNGVSRLEAPEQNTPRSAEFNAIAKLIASAKARGQRTMIYAGALGPPNGMELLMEALQWGAKHSPSTQLNVIVLGSGVSRDELQESAQNLKHVRFFDPLSKGEAQQIIEMCDIAYAGCRPVPELYQYGMAMNKLASYLDAGLPILLATDPCGDPGSEVGCGVTRGFSSPDELWNVIDDFAQMPKDELIEMGRRGQEYAATVLDYQNIARKYIDAMFNRPD